MNADPSRPGYRHIVFRPVPPDSLTFARYDKETPYGEASIEWRRENGIPFDKSTIAASPSEVDGGEFDTMDEALRYLYTCLNFPDSVLC